MDGISHYRSRGQEKPDRSRLHTVGDRVVDDASRVEDGNPKSVRRICPGETARILMIQPTRPVPEMYSGLSNVYHADVRDTS